MLKAFTLIELLIVMAIIGVISSGLIIAINPLQKINLSKDAKVKADVATIISAYNAFYTVNGYYPAAITDLVTFGELKSVPSQPAGYAAYGVRKWPNICTTAAKNCINMSILGEIKAPATTGNTRWCYRTSNNIASEVLDAFACPQ